MEQTWFAVLHQCLLWKTREKHETDDKNYEEPKYNWKPKTYDEIEDAISYFLKHGGKIKQLEAQQNETLSFD